MPIGLFVFAVGKISEIFFKKIGKHFSKIFKKIYSTGFFFSAATSSFTPDSTSRMSSTSTGEWMYRVGGLMVVLGMPPFVRWIAVASVVPPVPTSY
jgi:hypothetical protein